MWSPEARHTFEDIQTSVCTNVVLYAPLPNQPTCLDMDANQIVLGSVLTQDTLTGERPIFFFSCKLSKAEQNYAIIEQEALAICWAVEHFKY